MFDLSFKLQNIMKIVTFQHHSHSFINNMRSILLLSVIVAVCSASCGNIVKNELKYNLDPLSSSVDYIAFSKSTNATFYYNFCQNIRQTSCAASSPVALASNNDCTPLGFLPADVSTLASGFGIKIVYTKNTKDLCGNPGTVPRVATFFLVCNLSVTYELLEVQERATCQYEFTASTKYACPITVSVPTPAPPDETDCCKEESSPGCANTAIQQCVCKEWPFCCIDNWDAWCVSRVEELGCGECKKTSSLWKIGISVGAASSVALMVLIWAIFRCKIPFLGNADGDPLLCSKCSHSLHHSGMDNLCQGQIPNTHVSCECSRECGRSGCHGTAMCRTRYTKHEWEDKWNYYTGHYKGKFLVKKSYSCYCDSCNCNQCAPEISCGCKKCQCDGCAKKHIWCWIVTILVPWLVSAIILIADSKAPRSVRFAGVIMLGVLVLLGTISSVFCLNVIRNHVDHRNKWK